MALPSSGPLSIGDIRNEQVNNGGFSSTYSLRTLSSNAGKGTPDAISEFYGYAAAVDVTINWYIPYLMTCYADYTVSAATTATLNTSIEVDIYWYGDLGGYAAGTINMPTNTSCNTTTISTGGGISCWGENISNSTINYYPASGTGQNYIGGGYNPIGMSPC